MKTLAYRLLLIYTVVLSFYIFMSMTNIYKFYIMESTLNSVIPTVLSFFYVTKTQNNCPTSLNVAARILMIWYVRLVVNKKLSNFVYFCMSSVILSVVYLSIRLITEAIFGALLVIVVIFLLNDLIKDTYMTQLSNEIERKVLELVAPSPDERRELEDVIEELKECVKQEIKKRKLPVFIKLVGSTAKDTYLKNSLDIDLFLLFPTSISKEDIARNALSIGRLFLKDTEECYAEHPYIRGYFKDCKAEIVPCYKIENASQKLSAVDRTPLHTEYVKKYLSKPQRHEVRLFKQFLKGIGCYGAEAEVEGFSGYLCEILIIRYDSFQNLVQNAQSWKYGKKLTLSDGNHQSFDNPLTFIDPVDNDRNVASALSKEKFDLFVKACEEYLQYPRVTFFFPNETQTWSLNTIKSEIQKQKCLYIGVVFSKPDIIVENLYPQIRKAARSISEACERYGFTIFDTRFHVDESGNLIFIIIKTKNELISKTLVHVGPPVKLEKNVRDFILKWEDNPSVIKKPYEKNGRFYVEIKRKFRNIKDFLKYQVKNLSMGKHLDEIIKEGYDIVEIDYLLRENLHIFWTGYLDGKMSWER